MNKIQDEQVEEIELEIKQVKTLKTSLKGGTRTASGSSRTCKEGEGDPTIDAAVALKLSAGPLAQVRAIKGPPGPFRFSGPFQRGHARQERGGELPQFRSFSWPIEPRTCGLVVHGAGVYRAESSPLVRLVR